MLIGRQPLPHELRRERSILLACELDGFFVALIIAVGIFSGSLTVLAEVMRIILMLATEVFSLLAMRRIHRGQLSELEFGTGKLEQMINLVIAIGMIIGAIWIGHGAVTLLLGTRPHSTPVGLAFAAAFMACNTWINFVVWLNLKQVATAGSSLLMQAQLRSRLVKLASSVVVSFFLTLSAVFPDPDIASWCDLCGAVFVTGFLLVTAIGMIRTGLPDLLDRSVEEFVQISLNRALAHHFNEYDRLDRVRTRRSGDKVFVEIALGFDGRLPLAEIDRRIAALKTSISAEIGPADISILASSLQHGSSQAADSAKA